MVPAGSRVADIGCGHGILPRRLLASSRASHCIATERTAALLGRVETFRPGHPLAGGLERRHGDGLAVLTPEDRIDVVTIAGLGACSMVRLLEDGYRRGLRFRRFVLQPQGDVAHVRRWLAGRDLAIVAERMIRERRRFYVVIAAEPGGDSLLEPHPSLSPEDLLEAGPCLVRSGDPLVRRYWTEQLARLESVVRRAAGPGGQAAAREHRLAMRVLDALPHRDGAPSPH